MTELQVEVWTRNYPREDEFMNIYTETQRIKDPQAAENKCAFKGEVGRLGIRL